MFEAYHTSLDFLRRRCTRKSIASRSTKLKLAANPAQIVLWIGHLGCPGRAVPKVASAVSNLACSSIVQEASLDFPRSRMTSLLP